MIAACTVPTFGTPRGQPNFRLPDAEFVAAIEQCYDGTMFSRLPPHALSTRVSPAHDAELARALTELGGVDTGPGGTQEGLIR